MREGDSSTEPEATRDDGFPRQIGPYRLLQRIGEGGFGIVYLAEQRAPVVRRVALKILKGGMDTRQVIARFEAERQALAMMDHPNIATVLDAGATAGGRPYFVMELVHGDPITDYCDRHTLTTAARLKLFAQVCQAVQHAHQKGVIHRDLKPSNVLVAVVDGSPVPKVIDFGIAKATTIPLTDKTIVTELHQAIGTPEYMSPEQAEMTGVDIDTRADIYSLGVLLYELLTGTTPFERERLRRAAIVEMQRIIREVDPPTPSTRLRDRPQTLAEVAARRGTDAASLPGSIRGDLDWIVMRCLEKDRTRRYDTANGLGLDVLRHLSGEPILAAPPDPVYRARKFVRRHRAAVLVAAALVALLAAGTAGTTYGLLRAEARRLEAEAQRAEAVAERETAEEVLRVFREMLDGVKGGIAQGRDTALLRQILDGTRSRIDAGEFADRPRAEVTLRHSLGLAYLDLGDLSTAERMLSGALRLLRESHLADRPRLADALAALAGLTYEAGRVPEAEALFRSALEVRRGLTTGDDADLARVMANHASMLDRLGRTAEAVAAHREALAMRERLLKGDHEDLAYSKANLAFALQNLGEYQEAARLHRETIAMRQRLYPGPHPQVAVSMNNLAILLGMLGQYEESESLYRESLGIRRRLYPGDHPLVGTALANLGYATMQRGRYVEAESLLREALTMRRRIFPADHPDLARNLNNLGVLLRLRSRLAEAETTAREALDMGKRLMPGDHPSVALSLNDFALVLLARGRTTEAEATAREAAAMQRRLFAGDHRATAQSLDTVANVLMARLALADADAAAREALAMRERLFRGDHPEVAESLRTLAGVLIASSRSSEAIPLADRALAMARRALGETHPALAAFERRAAEARRATRDRL